MPGFQSAAHRLAQLPSQPSQGFANGGSIPFGSRGLAGLRDMAPKMAAMGYQQPAPPPATAEPSNASRLLAMIPQMEAMGYKQAGSPPPQHLASGGLVRGPGTGTSDSIEAEAEPGTFIMPADSTEAIGPSALERLGTVPVNLSNGEFSMPPEQVMGLGAAVLGYLKDATHTPAAQQVNEQDGVQAFANGGIVGNEVTRVGNSYSGGSVGGNITVNGQAPQGAVSTVDWTARPQPTPAAAQVAAASTPAPARTAAQVLGQLPSPAPTPAATAPSVAQTEQGPQQARYEEAPQETPPVAPKRPLPQTQPMDLSSPWIQPITSALGDLSGIGGMGLQSMRPGFGLQPRNFADGGLVEDEPRANNFGDASAAARDSLVRQIPTGGLTAPASDNSQNGVLNNELGRNAMNTLSALPGTGGFASRAGGGVARAAGGALSTERVVPAAWDLVQEGGAMAKMAGGVAPPAGQIAGGQGGALARAAGFAQDASMAPGLPGRAAQMLGAPPQGGQLAQRTATQVGEASVGAAPRAANATQWADVVQPAALGAPQAAPSAASILATPLGLGRYGTGAAGLGAAALLAGSAGGGEAAQSPVGMTVAQAQRDGLIGERVGYDPAFDTRLPGSGGNATPPASQQSPATAAMMQPPQGVTSTIVRNGNSYSGPANISGDVNIVGPDGVASQRGGGISAKNMAAAENLSNRNEAETIARLTAQQQDANANVQAPRVRHSGNDWEAAKRLRELEGDAKSITNQKRWGGEGANSADSRAYQAALGEDFKARGMAPEMERAAMSERGVNSRALLKLRGDNELAKIAHDGAMQRTLVTERGSNRRAEIAAGGTVEAARLKAQQDNKAPAGYRYTAGGNMEVVPGGPAAAKAADDQKAKDSAFEGSRQAIGTINRLLTSPGREGATGTMNLQRFIPGNASADFAAEVETLKAQTFLPMVQQLKGMGALSNAEGDKLGAAIGALNFNMSEKAFQESLGRIRDHLGAAVQRSGMDTKDIANWGLEAPSSAGDQGARPAGASTANGVAAALAPLPARDKLVAGTAYQTPRGMATWDGKQFTLSN